MHEQKIHKLTTRMNKSQLRSANNRTLTVHQNLQLFRGQSLEQFAARLTKSRLVMFRQSLKTFLVGQHDHGAL